MAAIIWIFLVPTFGLSYICIYPHLAHKAWRINKKLQHISIDNVWKCNGALGFQMAEHAAADSAVRPEGATSKPMLWIKPPWINV